MEKVNSVKGREKHLDDSRRRVGKRLFGQSESVNGWKRTALYFQISGTCMKTRGNPEDLPICVSEDRYSNADVYLYI